MIACQLLQGKQRVLKDRFIKEVATWFQVLSEMAGQLEGTPCIYCGPEYCQLHVL